MWNWKRLVFCFGFWFGFWLDFKKSKWCEDVKSLLVICFQPFKEINKFMHKTSTFEEINKFMHKTIVALITNISSLDHWGSGIVHQFSVSVLKSVLTMSSTTPPL